MLMFRLMLDRVAEDNWAVLVAVVAGAIALAGPAWPFSVTVTGALQAVAPSVVAAVLFLLATDSFRKSRQLLELREFIIIPIQHYKSHVSGLLMVFQKNYRFTEKRDRSGHPACQIRDDPALDRRYKAPSFAERCNCPIPPAQRHPLPTAAFVPWRSWRSCISCPQSRINCGTTSAGWTARPMRVIFFAPPS